MSGLTLYNSPDANHRDIFAAPRQLLCGLRNFTCARHPDHGYLLIGSSVSLQTIYSAGKQLGGYKFVEPADDNCVITFAGCYTTFYLFNHTFISPNNFRVLSLPDNHRL